MSTNPEGNPQTTQDVIAALHLKLHHAEMQRDSAMTLLKAEMKEIVAETFIDVGGQLGLIRGRHPDKQNEFVCIIDYIKETARLQAEVERLRKAGDWMREALEEGPIDYQCRIDRWNAAKEGKPSV